MRGRVTFPDGDLGQRRKQVVRSVALTVAGTGSSATGAGPVGFSAPQWHCSFKGWHTCPVFLRWHPNVVWPKDDGSGKINIAAIPSYLCNLINFTLNQLYIYVTNLPTMKERLVNLVSLEGIQSISRKWVHVMASTSDIVNWKLTQKSISRAGDEEGCVRRPDEQSHAEASFIKLK